MRSCVERTNVLRALNQVEHGLLGLLQHHATVLTSFLLHSKSLAEKLVSSSWLRGSRGLGSPTDEIHAGQACRKKHLEEEN